MLAVAKDYEVSANYLALVCAALNVPWPPRGYWAKVAAGQKPKRPALPTARPGDQLQWSKGAGLDIPPTRPPRAPAKATQQAESPAVEQPPQPARHALVLGVREFFEIDRLTEHGYRRPRKRLLVDIVVCKAMLSTALDHQAVLLDDGAPGPLGRPEAYQWWFSARKLQLRHEDPIAVITDLP